MSAIEILIAWVGIGLAASIAGWIWPFRRGIAGIAMNVGISVGGAVLFGILGILFGLYRYPNTGAGFLLVAIGAIGALVLFHAIWSKRTRGPRHAHR
jgi:hypothetical protein